MKRILLSLLLLIVPLCALAGGIQHYPLNASAFDGFFVDGNFGLGNTLIKNKSLSTISIASLPLLPSGSKLRTAYPTAEFGFGYGWTRKWFHFAIRPFLSVTPFDGSMEEGFFSVVGAQTVTTRVKSDFGAGIDLRPGRIKRAIATN